jgi:hypothetical protein
MDTTRPDKPESDAGRFLLALNLAGLAAGIVLLLVHVRILKPYLVDDAYISLRYLRQLVAGNGLVYNVGEHVEGYSNFLWIMLLAPGAALGIPILTLTRILGVVCTVGAITCTWGLVRRLSPGTPAAGVAAIVIAALTPVAFWSMGGLEAPLVAALLAGLGWSLAARQTSRMEWQTGLLLGLLPLARPEMVIVGALLLAIELGSTVRGTRRWVSPTLIRQTIPLLAIFIPYTIWRITYFGNLLPTTVRAKSTGLNLRSLVRGGYYFWDFMSHNGIMLIVALALIGVGLGLNGGNRRVILRFSLITLVYMALVAMAGGDWMPESRLLVPLFPFLIALAAVGAMGVWDRLREVIQPAWLRVTVPVAVLVLQVGASLFDTVNPKGILGEKIGAPPQEDHWVSSLRPDDSIMVVSAGLLAYDAPLTVRVIDMVGLTNNAIANRPSVFPGGPFAHYNVFGKWDLDYYLAQNPRFVEVLFMGIGPDGRFQTGFIGATELVNDPRFKARYFMRPDGIFERRS